MKLRWNYFRSKLSLTLSELRWGHGGEFSEGQYHIFLHDCPCWNYRSNSLFIQGWGGEETRPETKISKLSQDMQPFLLAIFLFWQVYFSRIVCVTFEQDDVVTICIKCLYCWWNIDLVSQGINGIFPLFFCSNKNQWCLILRETDWAK